MSEESFPVELKVESVIVLGSLTKGPEHIAQCVIDAGLMSALVKGNVLLCYYIIAK